MTFLPIGRKTNDGEKPTSSHRPSLPSISRSAPRCTMSCARITCDDWDKGGIFDWYKAQTHTTIRRIELRKERERFKHEFVLVFLDQGGNYRIDRRPLGGRNPELLLPEGIEAEDTVNVVDDDDLEGIHRETDVEVVLKFNESKPDMYTVIAICAAVHMDPETAKYTLQYYNCFFLARTIIALTARYCLLQGCSANKGLRWDCITESAISCDIFGEDWNKLRMAIRLAIATRLEKLLLDFLKTRITKEKDWNRLRSVIKKVVHGKVVMDQEIDVDDEARRAVNEWILDATEVTLWHENLEQNLSESRYSKSYRTTAEGALNGVIKSVLDLPDKKMEKSCKVVLECCTQRRPVKINLQPELLERIPVGALEKLPDDLYAKLPRNLLQAVSMSYLERLSVDSFSRMNDSTIVTLPNDLSCVPSRLLEVSLERMQRMLDQPNNPDRNCALRLLHQLPKARLEQLAQAYIIMRDDEFADEPSFSAKAPVTEADDNDQNSAQVGFRTLLLRRIKKTLKDTSFIGFLMRVLPIPLLDLLLPVIIKLTPQSSLKSIPTSKLARIPPEHMAEISTRVLDKLPEELLSRLPESLLMRPQTLRERLIEALLQSIPRGLLNNLPVDVTSVLRQVISTNACESDELREELRSRIWVILKETLLASCGEIPENMLHVSIRISSLKNKQGTRKIKMLRRHEEVQRCILDMTRKHSKVVANLAHFGTGEGKVFHELRDKTEDVWQEPDGPLIQLNYSNPMFPALPDITYI
ncbi:hypothetical protein F5887DRAFT_1199456 [Amanita rubescens]|nr:hypothetical protein F5887DRAFT_1244713 [Amanita rubescens]KAF8345039.1 hypothetical protein F5887DRAFT_1199456 [Amanita rubescens]